MIALAAAAFVYLIYFKVAGQALAVVEASSTIALCHGIQGI